MINLDKTKVYFSTRKKTFIVCDNISNDLHRAPTQRNTALCIPPVVHFQNLFFITRSSSSLGQFSVFRKILSSSVDSTPILVLIKCLRSFAKTPFFPFFSVTDYLKNEANAEARQ